MHHMATLIHMKLIAGNFEKYHCTKPIACGISMMRLFKLLKMMSPNDTLTFMLKMMNLIFLKYRLKLVRKILSIHLNLN